MSELRKQFLNDNLVGISILESVITGNQKLADQLAAEFTEEERLDGLTLLVTVLGLHYAKSHNLNREELLIKLRQMALALPDSQ